MVNIYLDLIVPGSMILPLAVFIARYKKIPPFAYWIIVYLVGSAILNITAIIYAHKDLNNLWLFHIYTIFESVVLMFFFLALQQNGIMKSIIRVLLFSFPVLCIVNFLFLQSLYNFNTYTRPLESIIFLSLCAVYWWNEKDDGSALAWADKPVNWIISGIMLYFAGSFFLFLFSNYLLDLFSGPEKIHIQKIAWNIHASFVLFMYLLFSIGLSKFNKIQLS